MLTQWQEAWYHSLNASCRIKLATKRAMQGEHAGSTRCREHRKRVDNGASPLPGVQNITWVDCPGHLEDAA